MNKIYPHIIRFAIVVILQILIFNNIRLFGYYNPYIYLIFLLSLPVHTKNWLLLVLGFITGFTIDVFSGVLGLHAAACVLACATRPFLIKLFHNVKEIKQGVYPEISWFDIKSFVLYTLLFVFIHHLALFFLDVFTLQHFFRTLFLVIINTLITSSFVMIDQFIFHTRGKKP
ncbi:rod shape-determining protein MreD [Odoribacter sp. OttesenSCG-928-L07]|nr:rod shape-determining protein MreD [Odoribacter sp. OttesenSCG-928-L07]MDL2238696.1 rod shape-determining protein MreD [Bacteroidales bacterium OttesenSCG-928-L14]MDL2241167.1 rod shape-determining protein MreD [Bacteroidales bacterium OttesenSCG-928-K22]